MSLLKSIERIQQLNDLIRREATGTAIEFADKIGISRSMLMENIREMKELGAMIEYCPFRRSYFYTEEFKVIIGAESKRKILGGCGYDPQEAHSIGMFNFKLSII
jgi:hypothetical protein